MFQYGTVDVCECVLTVKSVCECGWCVTYMCGGGGGGGVCGCVCVPQGESLYACVCVRGRVCACV